MKKEKNEARVRTRKVSSPEPGWQEWVSTNGVLGNSTELAIPDDSASMSADWLREATSRLAYSYWESRGCQGGSAEEDWHRAEMEIRSRASAIRADSFSETV